MGEKYLLIETTIEALQKLITAWCKIRRKGQKSGVQLSSQANYQYGIKHRQGKTERKKRRHQTWNVLFNWIEM